MEATMERETVTPTSASEQLRACADWLDQHPCNRCLSVSCGGPLPPKIYLSLEDMRRHFSGEVARKTVGQHCTTYSIERDGFEFCASEWPVQTNREEKSDVTL